MGTLAMPYYGDIIEESLSDKTVLEDVHIASTRVEKVTPDHKTPWLKQWTLHTIEVAEVFAFTINPKNTPKYVDSILAEQTNEWPVKLGSIYRNQRKNGECSEYEVIAFEPNKLFVIRQQNDGFDVGYTFTPINDDATELEHRVWEDKGELPATLTTGLLNDILEKLKEVVEAES